MIQTNALALLAALAVSTPSIALADGFKLIVNAEQKTQALSREEASRIFLKKVTRWSDGGEIRVVQPKADSGVRKAFDPEVHRLQPSAVRAYWAQMVFSGRDVPPVEKASEEAIVDFVKQNPGAIGLVSVNTSVGGGVKVVDLK